MTTRPSVDQARAYADALVAWAEGKPIEERHADVRREWMPFKSGNFGSPTDGWEYRIAPTPPKLREIEVPNFDYCATLNGEGFTAYNAGEYAGGDDVPTRFREVSETADAEMAELRRNHDALCRAINEYYRDDAERTKPIGFYLDKHGAILK